MVILLTGASSGIGFATAARLSRAGHKVYGTYRSNPPKNPPYVPLFMDVNDEDSVEAAVNAILKAEGRLDALVNNAGMGVAGPIELTSEEEAARQINVNYLGTLTVTRIALPALRASGGRIVCVSSLAAQIPIAYQAIYTGSKAALEATMQALQMECKPFKIRCTCVELGDTKTSFTKNRVFAAKTEGDTVYGDRFKKSVSKMEKDEQSGYDPDKPARFIQKQLERRSPPPLAPCGALPKLIYVLRKLFPLRFSNWIISFIYA